MYIRSLLLATALLLPTVSTAATAADTTQSDGSANSQLGPSTAGGVSSSADGSSLQPAGVSPLQATTQDASGLNPSSTSPLQAGSTGGDQLKVLLGSESDGQNHEVAASSDKNSLALVGTGLMLLIAAGGYFWSRRSSRTT